ncbi:hypothetical protein DEI86_06465 [Curtobacterium sp. MCBD17_028]|nr:hypothetical protein DEI86_06465 [Curtobacterium sp. MCBD17_028]
MSKLYDSYVASVGEGNWPAIRFFFERDLAATLDWTVIEGKGMKRHRISVSAVVRHEPHPKKLSYALRELAKEIRREKEANGEDAENGDNLAARRRIDT